MKYITGSRTRGLSPLPVLHRSEKGYNGDLFHNADGATAGLGTGGTFAKLTGVSALSATDLLLQA